MKRANWLACMALLAVLSLSEPARPIAHPARLITPTRAIPLAAREQHVAAKKKTPCERMRTVSGWEGDVTFSYESSTVDPRSTWVKSAHTSVHLSYHVMASSRYCTKNHCTWLGHEMGAGTASSSVTNAPINGRVESEYFQGSGPLWKNQVLQVWFPWEFGSGSGCTYSLDSNFGVPGIYTRIRAKTERFPEHFVAVIATPSRPIPQDTLVLSATLKLKFPSDSTNWAEDGVEGFNGPDATIGEATIRYELKPIQLQVIDQLYNFDRQPLQFLSLSHQIPGNWFGGSTVIYGTITVKGQKDDGLKSLTLDVLDGSGDTITTAQLAPGARDALLTDFGDAGQVSIDTPQLLFQIDSADVPAILDDADKTTSNQGLTLEVTAETKKGEEATVDYGPVQELVLYTGSNRYEDRRPDLGGDSWIKPSVRQVLMYYSRMGLKYGQMSKMNGGPFPFKQPFRDEKGKWHYAHQLHQTGNDVDIKFADGSYDGEWRKTHHHSPQTAERMIGYLNDPTYGSRITRVYVTFDAVNCDAFCQAIRNVILDDGRPAMWSKQQKGGVIKPLENHTTHFHWTISD